MGATGGDTKSMIRWIGGESGRDRMMEAKSEEGTKEKGEASSVKRNSKVKKNKDKQGIAQLMLLSCSCH